MTKDELEKEATAYALEWGDKTDGTYACCRDGYLAGAEPREKRIAELEQENTVLKSDNEALESDKYNNTCNLDLVTNRLTYASTIIRDLLSNSDEYARQRAIDYLKGEENDSNS
jgi:hypothetical protein